MADYEVFMRRALELAARGRGLVEPNPMVGAVLLREGQVVGEGFHERFGGPHAEVVALANCRGPTAGTTLVVNLEPCCHWGKTPPCTQAIVAAGVRRVVIGCRDPFPAVSGRGVEELKRAGIEVVEGVLEAEARELNAPFFKLRTTGLPYVIAKWAMTLDGRIATATGDSRWITGPAARQWVHDLRGRVDAILVGVGTVLRDDPLLTCRTRRLRTAVRVVVDTRCRTPVDSRLVRTAREVPVVVAAGSEVPVARRSALEREGVEVVELPLDGAGRVDLAALLRLLGQREMTNLLVEGGAEVLGSFFDRRLVDEVAVFVAPKVVGGRAAVPAVAGCGRERVALAQRVNLTGFQRLGDDLLLLGRVVEENSPATSPSGNPPDIPQRST